MDLASPRDDDHLCYVLCAYCNTFLALQVGIPCKRLLQMDYTVTVKCGHCNHLSFLSAKHLNQASHYSHHDQQYSMCYQDPAACNDCRKRIQLSASIPSSTSIDQTPKGPFAVKPPEKKHRLPSAYNRFMREEIQRIKTAKPDIPHREAFSTASKNWAKSDPRGTVNPASDRSSGAMKTIMFQHMVQKGDHKGIGREGLDLFKQMEPQN